MIQLLVGYYIPPAKEFNYFGGVRVSSVWLGKTEEELSPHIDRAIDHAEECGYEALVLETLIDYQDEDAIKAVVDDLRKRVMEYYLGSHPELIAEKDDDYYQENGGDEWD